MRRILSKPGGLSPLALTAAGFLFVAFLMGGGSRHDIQSLVLLRPIAAIMLAVVIIKWPKTGKADSGFVRLVAAACVALAVLHLIPLPQAVWSMLPGRDILVQIGEAAGIAGTWRPLAMVPPAAWNALFSLIVPAAALAFALRLRPGEHEQMVVVFVLIGIASIIVGILQMLGGDGSPFYLYRIQNVGQLAGLFSNRNHQAIFLACLIPMLGFLASRPIETVAKYRMRFAGLALIVLFVGCALVVASSRAGAVAGLAAAIATVVLFRYPKILRRTHKHGAVLVAPSLKRWRILAIAALLVLAGLFFAFGSSAIGDRIADSGAQTEFRFQFWPPIAAAAWQYFPLGSGNGSFVEVYQISEPIALLQDTYLNHAHNDLLEIALTLGLPGLALALAVGVAWFRASRVVFAAADPTATVLLARVGSVVSAMLALASTVDYPLRTPSIACLFVFAMMWLSQGYACEQDRMRESFE